MIFNNPYTVYLNNSVRIVIIQFNYKVIIKFKFDGILLLKFTELYYLLNFLKHLKD